MTTMEDVQRLVGTGMVTIPVYAVGPDGTCKCPRGSTCPSPGKHAIGDKWDEQTQDEALKAFRRIEERPGAGRKFNAGILPGPSGLLIVDIDPRNGGTETMIDLLREHTEDGKFPPTLVVNTGSGGWHYYFRRPEGVRFRGKLGKGVDLKTTGMVVAEGSTSGKGEYTRRDNTPIADTPDWIVEMASFQEMKASVKRGEVDLKDPNLPRKQAYCRSGVQKEIERLEAMSRAKVPNYEANGAAYRGEPWDQTVYDVACTLFEFANTPEAGMSHQDVVDIVLEKAPVDDSNFPKERVEAKIRSARDRVGDKGRDLSSVGADPFGSAASGGVAGGSPATPAPEMRPIDRMVGRMWKDAHIVEAFAEHHARELRHVDGVGWLRLSDIDGYWIQVEDGVIQEMSRVFAHEMHVGAADIGDQALSAQALKRLGRTPINNVAAMAANIKALHEDIESLDGDPELLNCANGYVNLRTGELYPHDPDKMMTKSTGVVYRQGFTHPDVDMALECLDPAEREWFQLACGQALTGYIPPEDGITFLHGGGANGKTALASLFQRVVGTYGVTLSEKVLMTHGNSHTTDVTDLLGARIAVLEELPEAGALNMERAKKVAGSERVKARRMHQNNIEWSPTHTIFVTTNHRPKVVETDHGSWRRLVLLTFPYRYVRSEDKIEADNDRVGDIGLRQRLKGDAQKEAFLAWAIEGAHKYLSSDKPDPLDKTQRMLEDWEDWRAGSDPMWRFISDMLEMDPSSCVASSDLFDEFKNWLNANGHPAWSSQLMTARLEGHHAAPNVKRAKIRVGPESGLSLRPGPVQVEYKDGQQIRVWRGMKWRKDPA